MTDNPYKPATSESRSGSTSAPDVQRGVLSSTWRGARKGARVGAIIGGALALLPILAALGLSAFGAGTGAGWALPKFFRAGFGCFFFFVLLGGLLGAGIGLIRASVRSRTNASGLATGGEPMEISSDPATKPAPLDELAPNRRRVLWPWFACAGILIAVLIVSLAGYEAGATVGGSVDRRLTAAIDAADRDDPNWRLDDLLENRTEVADEENSALVMAEVLALLPPGWLATTQVSSGEKGTRLGQVKEDFSRLEATPGNTRLSDAVADSLRSEMNALADAVKLARTLEEYRLGRHEVELGPTIQDTRLHETQDARIVARLLVVDSAVRAHDGDHDGALDSCRAIFGAGRSIGDEPFLISGLVRIAIGSVALQSARRVLGQEEPSDLALARFQATVLDELAEPLLVSPMRGERAAYTELIRRVTDGELPISALSGDVKPVQAIPRPSDSPWTKLWFDYQIAVYLEWMNKAVSIVKAPAPEQPLRWKAWQANVDAVRHTQIGLYTATLPILLCPGLEAAGTAFSRYQADLGATAILIAAERHRRTTGAWPASIEAIDRSILRDAPVDPYSGQPFRMEKGDGMFVVHSIGPNGKDERGDYDPKRWPKGGRDDVARERGTQPCGDARRTGRRAYVLREGVCCLCAVGDINRHLSSHDERKPGRANNSIGDSIRRSRCRGGHVTTWSVRCRVARGEKRDAGRGVVFRNDRLCAGHSGSCGYRVRSGAGRGLGFSSYVPVGIGIFLLFTFLGAIIGGTTAIIAAVFSRARSGEKTALDLPTDELLRAAGDARGLSGAESRKRRRRRWPWFVGVPVLLILTAAFILGTYVGRVVDRRLAAAIAAADRDDPYWRLGDTLARREEVPADQNSAPVMDEVMAIVPETWSRSRSTISGVSSPDSDGVIVAFNELADIPTNVRLSNQSAETLRGELKKYERALVPARTLATYSRGRHELTIGPAVIDTLLPHVYRARTIARLLVADSEIRARDGDIDGALDSCRAIFATARSIGDEPFLISHLVRAAVGEVALHSTARVLGQGEASDRALARVQELMLDEMAQPLLMTGVKGERATLAEIIRRLGAGEVSVAALSDGGGSSRDAPPGAVAPWGKLWFDQQLAVALERMTQAVAIARRPVAEQPALWREWQADAERVKKKPFAVYTELLPMLLSPAVATASSGLFRYQTDLAGNAVLVAAERHRRKTGKWPTAVAAIDPTILPSAPVDPFSGESFRMEHRDGQLFVYSIGPNGQDEHGAYEPKRWMEGGPDDAGGRGWDVSLRGQPALAKAETNE